MPQQAEAAWGIIVGRKPQAETTWGIIVGNLQAAATLTELPRVRNIHYGLTKIHHRMHTICHNPPTKSRGGCIALN